MAVSAHDLLFLYLSRALRVDSQHIPSWMPPPQKWFAALDKYNLEHWSTMALMTMRSAVPPGWRIHQLPSWSARTLKAIGCHLISAKVHITLPRMPVTLSLWIPTLDRTIFLMLLHADLRSAVLRDSCHHLTTLKNIEKRSFKSLA